MSKKEDQKSTKGNGNDDILDTIGVSMIPTENKDTSKSKVPEINIAKFNEEL